ncbi:MAG: ABC transporter permease [Bacteroidota bacterium]
MSNVVIEAGRNRLMLNIRELWRYKDLFWLLAYRDYRIRYAQTALGFVWAFIQPFATLLIFTVVFGVAAKVDTKDIPYPLFAICGMTAWTFFSYVLSNSSNSIITSQQMVKKIYFPRLIIPLSKAVVGIIDFFIALLFIVILCIYYKFVPSANIIYLPLFAIMTIISSLAVGIWMSALTIRFRDLQHVVPFLVQLGLYATPIAYPAEMLVTSLPKWATVVYFINPMAGAVEGFRWSILGGQPPNDYIYISFILVLVLFVTGLFYFRKVERTMADIV